jgi:hypothetical protein
MEVRATTRGGGEFVLESEDPEALFGEPTSRGGGLTGWFAVAPEARGHRRAMIRSDEIVELRLVDEDEGGSTIA